MLTAYCSTGEETNTSRTARIMAISSTVVTTGSTASSGLVISRVCSMASSADSSGYPIEIRAMKRSRCASGSGYVPSISTGFWVAMTVNGVASALVLPSTVTWPSSMLSSRADWVFGLARLISSPMTMFANTGPGLNSNSRVAWL